MRKTILVLAGVAALATFAPTASFAQLTVDTPVGGVRVGEPRDHWREDGWRERRGWHDRDVGLRQGFSWSR